MTICLVGGYVLIVLPPRRPSPRSDLAQPATETVTLETADPRTYPFPILNAQDAISRSLEMFPPNHNTHGVVAKLVRSGTDVDGLGPVIRDEDPDAPAWIVALLGDDLTNGDVIHVPVPIEHPDQRPVLGAIYIWSATTGLMSSEYGILDLDGYQSIVSLIDQPQPIKAATFPPEESDSDREVSVDNGSAIRIEYLDRYFAHQEWAEPDNRVVVLISAEGNLRIDSTRLVTDSISAKGTARTVVTHNGNTWIYTDYYPSGLIDSQRRLFVDDRISDGLSALTALSVEDQASVTSRIIYLEVPRIDFLELTEAIRANKISFHGSTTLLGHHVMEVGVESTFPASGYTVWIEPESGLKLKTQALYPSDEIAERFATELDMNAVTDRSLFDQAISELGLGRDSVVIKYPTLHANPALPGEVVNALIPGDLPDTVVKSMEFISDSFRTDAPNSEHAPIDWFIAEDFSIQGTKNAFVLQSTMESPTNPRIAQFWKPAWRTAEFKFQEVMSQYKTYHIVGDIDLDIFEFDLREMIFDVHVPSPYDRLSSWTEPNGMHVAVLSFGMTDSDLVSWIQYFRSASGK